MSDWSHVYHFNIVFLSYVLSENSFLITFVFEYLKSATLVLSWPISNWLISDSEIFCCSKWIEILGNEDLSFQGNKNNIILHCTCGNHSISGWHWDFTFIIVWKFSFPTLPEESTMIWRSIFAEFVQIFSLTPRHEKKW